MEENANPVEMQEKTDNPFQTILNVFLSPAKAFQNLDKKPVWVYAFIIILLFAFAFQFMAKDLLIQDRIDKIEHSERLTREQKDSQIENASKAYDPPIIYVTFAIIAVFSLLFNAIASGLLMVTGNVIMGGKTSFKKMFSMYIHTGLVSLPNFGVKLPIILSKKSLDVQTGFAVFLDANSAETFFYRFMSHIDLFAAWQVILVAIGFSMLYKFNFKKSLTVIIVLQLIYSLIAAAGGSILGSAFGG